MVKPTLIGLTLLLLGCEGSSIALKIDNAPNADAISKTDCEAQGDFIYVPAGEFISGSDRTERDYGYGISARAMAEAPEAQAQAEQSLRDRGWFDQEPRRQRQSLPAFCMARNLVTNRDYQMFVRATGHRSPGISAADYQRQGFLVHPYSKVTDFLWQGEAYPEGTAEHPVVLVSYDDAVAFATWLGQQEDAAYRLPRAEEWERSARGSDGRYFPWGNDWRDDGTNWAGAGLGSTSPVGQFPLSRSPDGIEDLAGNVFEYTANRTAAGRVVMKGCSWDDLPGFCRGAYRHSRPAESRHILFGFRLVRER